MEILSDISQIHERVNSFRENKKTIGFIPTMGALHEGHLSLFRQARKECDIIIVSIYVNPTQFGINEDLSKYPKPFQKDCEFCRNENVDLVLQLSDEDMYPSNYYTFVNVEYLTETLCGSARPTHFRGVTTIVTKLFNLAKPHRAYFGQKDAQQAAVIKRMASDLNFDIEVIICPIVRENDGLAFSSRNVYLSPEQRKQSVCINRGLRKAVKAFEAGEKNAETLKNIVKSEVAQASLAKIDYVEIVSSITLHPIKTVEENALLAAAVFFGNTRLIDNQMLPSNIFI